MKLSEEDEAYIRQIVAEYMAQKQARNQSMDVGKTIRELIELIGLGQTIYGVIQGILEQES